MNEREQPMLKTEREWERELEKKMRQTDEEEKNWFSWLQTITSTAQILDWAKFRADC